MMNFAGVLSWHAERHPDKEFVAVFREERYTFREFNQRVHALAAAFTEMGIGRGDIVAILLYNCSEFLITAFASNRVGAAFLPLNYRLAPDEFSYILRDAGAKAIVTEKEFHNVIESIRNDLPALQHYITLEKDDVPPGWRTFGELIQTYFGSEVPDVEVGMDDLHRLMYTSGTTARPKGVMLTYGNLYWKNIGHIVMFDITSQDRTLVVGPLYHVGGLDLPATGVIYKGGSLVILRRFDPVRVLEAIQEEKVTNVWLAPAMVNMLLQEPKLGAYDLSSVRFIIDGGEKMPEPLIRKLQAAFPNAWFADAYGLTETVSGDTFLEKEKTIEKIGSVGKPCLHLQVKIVDDDGREVPRGQTGEIVLKGPKVFKGYWNNPEATAEALRDGWFHTGDIGRIDEDGYLYIVDRKKDMIISGGENIASAEVERVLYEHPQVLEAAVVGMPHPKWGEVPKAYVVVKPGGTLTEQELIEWCQGKLAKFKIPKAVEFIDALPRNPSGKVLKRDLRAIEMQRYQKEKGGTP